jgi:sugar phosphate isomerase/epimerase
VYRALSTGAIGVKATFVEAVRLAADHGFQGVEVSMRAIEELGLQEVRRLLAGNHLLPAMTGMPVEFRRDEATFDAGMERLPAFSQAMADLGCTRVVTWLMPWHETLSYQAHFEQLRLRTARICEVLAPYGLRYGLEFVGPATLRAGKPNPFIHDLDGLLALIRAVGAGNLGILFDAFHWYTSGGTASDLYRLSDQLVVAVHVNDAIAGLPPDKQIDNQRTMPGETGVIDIAAFMKGLERIDYSGPIVVEPFCEWLRALPPEKAVAATAESLDRIWRIAGL